MNKFREYVFQKYDIPRDVLGAERITISANREIYIENYKSVARYAKDEIVLVTQTGLLHMCGKDLGIALLKKNEILLCGFFEKIYYEF